MLGLAKKKSTCVDPRRENKQLMLNFADEKSADFRSRKDKITLFWLSHRHNQLISRLVKNTSPYCGSRGKNKNN